jgi:hypothetical protein
MAGDMLASVNPSNYDGSSAGSQSQHRRADKAIEAATDAPNRGRTWRPKSERYLLKIASLPASTRPNLLH